MDWEASVLRPGLTLMLVGMGIVFAALLVLLGLMTLIRRFDAARRRRARRPAPAAATAADVDPEAELAGVLIAALALTMILEDEGAHDDESLVLTLRSLPRPYSNWWQGRISPASLPARPVGPPPRADVLRTPEPQGAVAPAPAGGTR
jgi:sodium pump decarboxylase gamma subunit